MAESSFDTAYLHDRIARWRMGDNAAVDDLLRACAGRLERLARKMLRGFPSVRGEADTNDVLNAACLRLLTALRSVQPASTREFFSLSGLQMRRELLDLAQRASRRKTVSLDLAESIADPGDTDLDLWSAFHQAVEALPSEQREVFSLVFYHARTQQQVGELLGFSERQARRLWLAAGRQLRDLLGGQFPTVAH